MFYFVEIYIVILKFVYWKKVMTKKAILLTGNPKKIPKAAISAFGIFGDFIKSLYLIGADEWNRTITMSPSQASETCASTSSATSA